jgi:hypothetical protein
MAIIKPPLNFLKDYDILVLIQISSTHQVAMAFSKHSLWESSQVYIPCHSILSKDLPNVFRGCISLKKKASSSMQHRLDFGAASERVRKWPVEDFFQCFLGPL